jgi:hypothetical protein
MSRSVRGAFISDRRCQRAKLPYQPGGTGSGLPITV